MLTKQEIKNIINHIKRSRDESKGVALSLIYAIDSMQESGLDSSKIVNAIVENGHTNDDQKNAFKIIRPFLRERILDTIL